MSEATICLIVLAVTVALFVTNRLPVEIVVLGSALALYATGLLDVGQVFAGFGEPVITFIAALFVISEGLGATGVTSWVGQWLMSRAGTQPEVRNRRRRASGAATRDTSPPADRRLLILVMLMAAGLTALISVNGATAALLPMVVLLAVRLGRSPSGLAMPLAFAGHAGSLLVLTSTPINLLVSDAAAEATGSSFGFFEYAAAGLPLLAGTIAIVVLGARRLLPERTPRSLPADLSEHSRTLIGHYRLDPKAVGPLVNRDLGVAELIVRPRSALVGDRVYPGMGTDSGELVIVAVARNGSTFGPDPVTLQAGDMLLVRGTWAALQRQTGQDPDVLVVDAPAQVRRQSAPLGRDAYAALGITGLMVATMASGLVPAAVAALVAAGAMVLLRVLTMKEAYAGISWTTLVIVAGMTPMSVAMQQSGAADRLAHLVVTWFGSSGQLLLAGLFLLTAMLGQVISNTATALIVIPIAVAAADEVGVSVRPVLITVAVAAAAALLTPIATAANLMVKEPGGYRFGDYARLGLPVLIWFGLIAIAWVPVVWRL